VISISKRPVPLEIAVPTLPDTIGIKTPCVPVAHPPDGAVEVKLRPVERSLK